MSIRQPAEVSGMAHGHRVGRPDTGVFDSRRGLSRLSSQWDRRNPLRTVRHERAING